MIYEVMKLVAHVDSIFSAFMACGFDSRFGTNKNNMAKVWVIGNRTCQKEGFFLQRLKQCRPNTKVQIFELVETSTVGEFQAQQEALKSSNEREICS